MNACVCLTGAAGRDPKACARARHRVPPVRDAWPARDRPRARTGARRSIPCADAAVGAYDEQSSAAAVVRMCLQLRLRALRIQVGGLVSHRVASMHALAHGGSQGHAHILTRIQEHPHRNTQTRARMEKECTSACTHAQTARHCSATAARRWRKPDAVLVRFGREGERPIPALVGLRGACISCATR